MLSFRSILFAAAAFATLVSAVPTPDVDSSLVQRAVLDLIGGLPLIGGLLGYTPDRVKGNTPTKRGGQSCYELVKQCHDDIGVIVIKIG